MSSLRDSLPAILPPSAQSDLTGAGVRPPPLITICPAALSAMKWLALVLMVIDHTNKYVFGGEMAWMYALGRIAMPLFVFVLGYNLARPGVLQNGGYARVVFRLVVCAVLATPPFAVLNPLLGGWWPLNMLVTLLVAVLVMWLTARGGRWEVVVACLVLAWGGALGEYWWPAVGACLCVWTYYRQPGRASIMGFVMCLTLLYFVNGNFWSLTAIPVIAALRLWRWELPRAQWFFYVFYPAHLWLFLGYSFVTAK